MGSSTRELFNKYDDLIKERNKHLDNTDKKDFFSTSKENPNAVCEMRPPPEAIMGCRRLI